MSDYYCWMFGHDWHFPRSIWKPLRCRRCGKQTWPDGGEGKRD